MQTGSVGWTTAPTRPEIVYHYSENLEIEVFAPHVPATNPSTPPQVWAIEPRYASLYWFPRDCLRVAVWANEDPQQRELQSRFATAANRVHFALGRDEQWIRTTNLCEYTFDAGPFEPWLDAEGHWTTDRTVRPTASRQLPDLVAEQAQAGVDLRFLDELTTARDEVVRSGLPFSVVRWDATRSQPGLD